MKTKHTPEERLERMKKYRIIHDYGTYEGMRFYEGEYDSVEQAVKTAIKQAYSAPFIIVEVIEWEATYKQKPPKPFRL